MTTIVHTMACGAIVAVAALATSAALAQASPNPDRAARMVAAIQQRFAAADSNGDGKLTRAEAEGKMPFVASHFDAIDTRHAGYVTREDIAAYAKTLRASRAAGP